MTALDQKLWRDLSRMRGQVLAITAVLGCGLSIFVGATTTHGSLDRAREAYYAKSRFAEIFCPLNRAPRSLLDRILEIPGVAGVQDRVLEAVTVSVAGFGEPVSGLLVSIPEDPLSQRLNRLVVSKGRWPERGRSREVLASEAFGEAHGLEPGDRIEAVLNGREETLTIAGFALAPDYLIEMPAGSFFPDNLRFGVLWMPLQDMEAAFEMEGAFNEVTLALTPDAMEEEVIRRLDDTVESYGGLGAYGRDDQLSSRFIADELAQLRVMSTVPPAIFLSVAAYLLNVSVRRLLSLQRSQIAVIKAFGYSTLEVGVHFLKLAAILITLGIGFGFAMGSWMGRVMTNMYLEFYRFPDTVYHPDPRFFGLGALIAFAAGGIGVSRAVVQSASIPPAEAMQPEPPAIYRRSIMDHLRVKQWLSPVIRMVVRELERRPGRAFFSVVGIAFACAGLIMGNFGRDTIFYIIDVQFGLSQRYDAAVTFHEVAPQRALHELTAMRGILAAEPFRAVPVRLRHGSRSKQTAIQGVAPGEGMRQLLDTKRGLVEIPENGLLVSLSLADTMGLSVGDTVRIEILERDRRHCEAVVNGIIEDFEGSSAFMLLPRLNELLREGRAISGAYLMIDQSHELEVYEALRNSPRVAGVNLKRASMQSFLDTIGENLLRMRLFNIAFATTIAVGVIYNSMKVVLSERSRELATMRVIGFRRKEVSSILLGHLAILMFCAVPLGLVIGTLFCFLVAQALTTDLYRLPFVIERPTYGIAALVVLSAAVICGIIINRGVRRLNLISVLKARE